MDEENLKKEQNNPKKQNLKSKHQAGRAKSEIKDVAKSCRSDWNDEDWKFTTENQLYDWKIPNSMDFFTASPLHPFICFHK